jgi:AraC family transcriptional regulator
MEVKIENFKPVRVAYMRNLGPYSTCGQTWDKFNRWMREQKVPWSGKLVIGASWDDPRSTPPEEIRYDCCLEVDDDYQPDDQVKIMEIQGGEYAVFRHIGPHGGIEADFQRLLREWFPQSGRRPSGDPCLEIYRSDHDTTPPEELITDLCVPLAPKE